MIWLVPLVALVGGRRGLVAGGLLGLALWLTLYWFPGRYWKFVDDLKPGLTTIVLLRDLLLVAVVGRPAAARQATATRSASHAVARPSASVSTSDALEPDVAVGGLEADAHPGAHARDRELRLHADHRVVRAGHAGVGDRRRAAREDARVVRLHVRVRPDDGADAAVEPARERDLLARRLGVEVDEDVRGLRRAPRRRARPPPRTAPSRRRGRRVPIRLITATGVPSRAGATTSPRPGRLRGEVRRPDDALRRLRGRRRSRRAARRGCRA